MPEATIIWDAFSDCTSLKTIVLTTENAIELPSKNIVWSNSTEIDLVLHQNNKAEVAEDGVTWKGYTFKSIVFINQTEETT